MKDNDKIFSLLKEYQIYTDNCKIYMDRYSVIEGIEYYDMENNLKTDGTIVVLDALADNVVKIFDFHTKCVNIYNKSLVELAEEKGVNLLEKYNENAHAFMKEVSSWCALGGNKVARRVRK